MYHSGKYGFMCQYDRKTDADTAWSVIYDIKNNEIFYIYIDALTGETANILKVVETTDGNKLM